MNLARTIRVPVHVGKEINSMKRSSSHLRSLLGREPTENEIALKMGKSKVRVQELKEAMQPTHSADAMILGTEDLTIYDVTEDVRVVQPCEQMNNGICKDMVHTWLNFLSTKERAVMMLRYGIGDRDDPWTLEAIGEHMGVTRERIRQIQVAALQKLRNLPEAKTMLLEEMV
jgi:RNA polymerase sigma factor (sigma-70 family)